MIKIKLPDKTIEIENKEGVSLSSLIHDHGIYLNMRCGGDGSCGGCAIALEEGNYSINNEAVIVGSGKNRTAISCKTKVLGNNASISVPSAALIELSGKISNDFKLKPYTEDSQTKKFVFEFPESTLENPLSEREKLEKLLEKETQLKNIYLPLDALQNLPFAIKEGKGQVTVTIGKIRSYWFIINIEPGDTSASHLAIAIDIGTTTVVGVLVDLSLGKIIARASLYNQQITKADDVAARISYASTPGKLKQLQRLVVKDTINPILSELCSSADCEPSEVNRLAVSGNTVMIHLFLGLSPESIGKIPFQPVTNDPGEYLAKDIGIDIIPHGIIDMIPSIAGYIGGDITSDIYVARMQDDKGISLMVDIGTNGEMVLNRNGTMLACATPAGPAFEGAGIVHGCRAVNGAIEKISITTDFKINYSVIGGQKAKGICGSAIIDFIGQAYISGLINEAGRFDLDLLKNNNLFCIHQKDCKESNACMVVSSEDSDIDGPIYISEIDIAQILQAKAAIFSGMKTLLSSQNISFDDIDRFILAGGFAQHINIENAIAIGLLPDIEKKKIEIIGNGSLAGAFLTLVEPNALKDLKIIAKSPETIELNLDPNFQPNYIDALFMPEIKINEILH